MAEEIDYFELDGVYRLNDMYDYLFLCTPSPLLDIGKLEQYKTTTPRKPNAIYEKTDVSYFLNFFYDDDVKSIFVKRTNYVMLGKIGREFILSDNKQYLYQARTIKNVRK